MVLTNLKSFPSNFRAFVNTTVLAGMLRPRANVSVANKAWQKKKTNNLFVGKKPEIIMSWLLHRSTTENVIFLGQEMERCRTVRICVETTNQQQFSMVCTLIDHRSDVNMFKTQVEPRTTGEWFHCKVLDILMSCLWSIRVKPWKIVVDLFFTITFYSYDIHFHWSFSENCAHDKE